MIAEAIDKIIELAKPFREKIGDVEYYDGKPIEIPQAKFPLVLSTLEGFADYVRSQVDGQETGLIHVLSPWEVRYLSALDPTYRFRESYVTAAYDPVRIFGFGKQYDPESFIIALMSLFEDNADRAKVLSIVGNMASEEVDESNDDGITQSVVRKAGTSFKKRETIQNPFLLRPHRTFAEIEQPESPFILRVHRAGDGLPPRPALYECDNRKWMVDAVGLIRQWLGTALKAEPDGVTVPIFA